MLQVSVTKMIKIWENSKYIFWWSVKFQIWQVLKLNILLINDLSYLILSKNGVPLSSLGSRLALAQVFLFFTYFPSSNLNFNII